MSEEQPSTTVKNRFFKKLECPFDLDAVFSMQYSVQGLKSVLEFILEHIGDLDELTGKTKATCDEHSSQLDAIRKELRATTEKNNQ